MQRFDSIQMPFILVMKIKVHLILDVVYAGTQCRLLNMHEALLSNICIPSSNPLFTVKVLVSLSNREHCDLEPGRALNREQCEQWPVRVLISAPTERHLQYSVLNAL